MDVKIDAETRQKLESEFTLRCLYRRKYDLDDRHSKTAIPWAETHVREFVQAFSSAMHAAGVSTQTKCVHLLGGRAYICFDIYLKECDEGVRREVNDILERPIHLVSIEENTYRMERNAALDTPVADSYKKKRMTDKGSEPYFADTANTPVYDNGKLRERSEADGSELDESVEDESEDEVDESDESDESVQDISEEMNQWERIAGRQ